MYTEACLWRFLEVFLFFSSCSFVHLGEFTQLIKRLNFQLVGKQRPFNDSGWVIHEFKPLNGHLTQLGKDTQEAKKRKTTTKEQENKLDANLFACFSMS